jgi:MFS family permease
MTALVASRSFAGLGALNFLSAAMQTGFGAFMSVFLTTHLWSRTDIGVALSIGTMVAILAQVPAGALVDALYSKRRAAGASLLVIAGSAVSIGLWPDFWPVVAVEVLHGVASCVLTPCIAALTLALARLEVLGERFGDNVRFAAIGSGVAAAVMGLVGYWISHRFVFFVAAGCGVAAVGALAMIRRTDLEQAHTRSPRDAAMMPDVQPALPPPRHVLFGRELVVFAVCVALFSLGNAAVLPLAANKVTLASSQAADVVVAAAIMVPQALAALLSPMLGRAAQQVGRRPILLLGFAALPVRALLFALGGNAWLLVTYQALDGISAAVLGMMLPLVVADLTRETGRFNLAMGVVGCAAGLGATFSTSLAGFVADHWGDPLAFLLLGGAGAAAGVLAWTMLPETGPRLMKPQDRHHDEPVNGRSQ